MKENIIPTVGELLNKLAIVLETKNNNRDFNTLSNYGDRGFDMSKFTTLLDQVFKKNYDFSPNLSHLLLDFKNDFLSLYRRLSDSFNGNYGTFNKQRVLSSLMHDYLSHFFINFVSNSLMSYELFVSLLKADNIQVEAFSWLNKEYAQWDLFRKEKETKHSDKDGKKKIDTWMNGTYKPSFKSLNIELEGFCKDKSIDLDNQMYINDIMFLSFVMNNLFKETKSYSFKSTIISLIEGSDLEVKFDNENNDTDTFNNENLSIISLLSKVYNLLLNKDIKRVDSHKLKIDDLLKELEKNIDLMKDNNLPWWQAYRLRGIWYVYENNLKDALRSYDSIRDIHFYSSDSESQNIFNENLIIAALLEDKSCIKNLKSQGISKGIYGRPYDSVQEVKYSQASFTGNHNVENWEIDIWSNKNEFYYYFPKELFFVDFDNSVFKSMPGAYVFGPDDLNKKPNLENPNEEWNVQGKLWPQLVWFAQLNKFNEVKQLIIVGANVNKLSSSGESALFFSVANILDCLETKKSSDKLESAHEMFNLLLSKPHSKAVLNIPTNKQKLTILGKAIETGDILVVESLLNLNTIDINTKYYVDNFTPLYQAIGMLISIGKNMRDIIGKLDYNDPNVLDGLRRANPMLAGLNNNDFFNNLNSLMALDDGTLIMDTLLDKFNPKYFTNVTSMLQIIEILLEKGANPNLIHENSYVKYYTSLHLASETTNIELCKLLVSKKANPEAICQKVYYGSWGEYNCIEIAEHFAKKSGNYEVVDYLNSL